MYNYVNPYLLNELINGISIRYDEFSDEYFTLFLKALNKFVRENFELFCFEENAVNNYKEIIRKR